MTRRNQSGKDLVASVRRPCDGNEFCVQGTLRRACVGEGEDELREGGRSGVRSDLGVKVSSLGFRYNRKLLECLTVCVWVCVI